MNIVFKKYTFSFLLDTDFYILDTSKILLYKIIFKRK